ERARIARRPLKGPLRVPVLMAQVRVRERARIARRPLKGPLRVPVLMARLRVRKRRGSREGP
ncbi:MAG TPA: hypothetical protein VIA10_14950, partial [Gaiellaceae bacterium]